MGGVQIKIRQHEGLTHQGSVVLHGLGEVIFGSSNWTTASASYQDEHNYFYNPSLGKPWFFEWFADQFEQQMERHRRTTSRSSRCRPAPRPTPRPLTGASGLASSVTLTWDGGPWAHLYDIYFGTTPNPPLFASNLELGSPEAGQLETFTVNDLQPGTTYYWRIVGKTWAQLTTAARSGASRPRAHHHRQRTTPFGGTPAPSPAPSRRRTSTSRQRTLAYVDTTAGNKGGVYRQTNVDIEATTDAGGG